MGATPRLSVRPRLRLSLHEIDLPDGTLTVGRSFECALTIADNLLSRKHAAFEIRDGEARVRDLQSRNGTFVNEQRVDGETVLRSGDRVRVGSQTLLYVTAGGHAEGATEALTPILASQREALWVDAQLELLGRARALGHAADVGRILDALTLHFDDAVSRGHVEQLDPGLLDKSAREIVNGAVSLGIGALVAWTVDLHRKLGRLPGAATMSALAATPRILLSDASRALAELLEATTTEESLFARDMLEELLARARR